MKQKVDRYYLKHRDETIDVFFRKFLLDYESACEMFSKFYTSFCIGLHIYDFTGRSFYLDI